jgi:hypothetical protein
MLIDTAKNKVPFDDKITQWVPRMTSGKQIDKSSVEWGHFVRMRRIRDDVAIHPKLSGFSTSNTKLVDQINLFKTGIARLLVNLHILFGDQIPAIIIRAGYAPVAEYIPDSLPSSSGQGTFDP